MAVRYASRGRGYGHLQLPKPCAAREETVERALEMISNTAPFDISHHPAVAGPCAMSHGLWDEPTIYRAAAAFEGAGDWKKM